MFNSTPNERQTYGKGQFMLHKRGGELTPWGENTSIGKAWPFIARGRQFIGWTRQRNVDEAWSTSTGATSRIKMSPLPLNDDDCSNC